MKKVFIVLGVLVLSSFSFQPAAIAASELDNFIFELSDLIYKENYKAALPKADAAIAKYPNDARLYVYRGIIKSELNSPKSALVDLDKAISLDPKSEDAYFWRGAVKKDLNSLQGAYKDFNTCIMINPNSSHCYSMRGTVKLELGDLQGATADLNKASTLAEKELEELQKYPTSR